MVYKVSFVISPAKGGAGRLLSVKGRHTEGSLEIRPQSNAIQLSGADALVRGIDRTIAFSDIHEIEGKGPEILVIKLVDGEEIQFKNVDQLGALLDELGTYCRDVTHDLVRKRIVKYEERIQRWGGGS